MPLSVINLDTVINNLEHLPVVDIISICRSSADAHQYLQDDELWRKLAIRDLFFTRNAQKQSWKKYYFREARREAKLILNRAAAEGNVGAVRSALYFGAKNYDSAMGLAAKYGHKTIVRLMLEFGVGERSSQPLRMSPKATSFGAKDYEHAMEEAAASGYIEIVQMLLAKGANFNQNIPRIKSAMAEAAGNGHIDIVLLLLMVGSTDYDGTMQEAAREGHRNIVELMFSKANNYNEVMREAAQGGHKDIIQLMLDNGATDYNMAMSYAACSGHMDIVVWMLSMVDCSIEDYNETMINAGAGGYIDIVRLMLSKGAGIKDLHAPYAHLADNSCDITMMNAADGGHIDVVQLMLDNGATDYGSTIDRAAKNGHMNIVKLMPTFGLDYYNTALEKASENGHIEIVQLLLQKGQKANKHVISRTAYRRHVEIVKLILDEGDVENANSAMKAVENLEYRNEARDLVLLALERGANSYKWVIDWAAENDHMDIVQAMLDKGVDLDAPFGYSRYFSTSHYNRAIEKAMEKGYDDIVQLIQKYKGERKYRIVTIE